eukprot:1521748-Amphidinium_carterae.3
MCASVLNVPSAKGASLRRSSPLELMAYDGPAGDPQVAADLNTIRVWQHKLNSGTLEWPLEESVWDNAVSKGRGRRPVQHLKILANRVGCMLEKIKWDSAEALLTEVARKQPDFAGLETGLSTQALLTEVAQKRPDFAGLETGLSTQAFRHEVRTRDLRQVPGRTGRPESHSLQMPPLHWRKERREVQLPEDDDTTPPCVKLHGLLPAPKVPAILTHEPALVNRTGVGTVWTDASGRH